jgi:outer membrane protein assembly factor BamB
MTWALMSAHIYRRLAAWGLGTFLLATPASAVFAASSVTTFQNSNDRAGDYVVPGLTFQTATRLHVDSGFGGNVSGHILSQPLYWLPSGTSNGEIVVATERNHLTALNATTGAVVWDRVLGTPIPASELPCGKTTTPLGVTGTPAIDPSTGTIYVAVEASQQGAPAVLVFALSPTDGSILSGWPVDVSTLLAAKGLIFLDNVQGQRGALTLVNGRVYVPFGGRPGDCGDYHGYVVGIDVQRPQDPTATVAWHTRALKGGVWAVSGVPFRSGDLFAATGNTFGATTWGDGEAVIRLPPDLKPSNTSPDFFAASNWQHLDAIDGDLGGTSAMAVDTGGRQLIVQLGKDGNAYLLDRADLGGIGGALAILPASTSPIIIGPGSWETGSAAFVAFAGASSGCPASQEGLTVLRITGGSTPAIGIDWCAALNGRGTASITTSDGSANRIIWVVGGDGDDRLHGFNAATGSVVFAGGGSGDLLAHVHRFSTITAAQGRLYVPGDGRIFSFTMQ